MKHPVGKGMFIFIVQNLFGGNIQAIVERAGDLKLNWIVMKGAHRGALENEELLPDLISKLRAKGVDVWLYQRMHGDPTVPEGTSSTRKAETNAALTCIERYNPTGWILDAEAEYYEQRNSARLHMAELRSKFPDLPIGLCSFRFPQFHQQLPWKEFLDYCDFHAPQVYWAGSTSSFGGPAQQLQRSIEELTALKELPVIPVGQAYREHGVQPNLQELNEFDQAVRSHGLAGLCWFRWGHVETLNFASTIAAHQWSISTNPDNNSGLNNTSAHMHVVQEGETLQGIAGKYQIALDSLVQSNPELLRPGMNLYLPSFPGAQPTIAMYVVRAGDTLSTIASRFHVELATLIRINEIEDPDQIFVGQVLQLSD